MDGGSESDKKPPHCCLPTLSMLVTKPVLGQGAWLMDRRQIFPLIDLLVLLNSPHHGASTTPVPLVQNEPGAR